MNLNKILENYGLTKKQAILYLACLELGSASVYKIAQKAGIPRSTSYEILEELKNKKLISTFRKKKVIYYNAENPKRVIEKTKESLKIFEETLPEFNALYASSKDRPSVRFYQGADEMKMIIKEIINETDIVKGFGSFDDLKPILWDFWPEFLNLRIKKKIPARVILFDSGGARERKRLGPKELREVRIIDKKYSHHGLFYIWKNKIAMFSFKKDLTALVIESKELAQTQMMMFDFMWDHSE